MNNPVIIGNATLYLGDCREILPTLPKVDAMITDPPWDAAKNIPGADNPRGLFSDTTPLIAAGCERAVIQLGCDTDPSFISPLAKQMPFLRVCWLEYALPSYKGRLLYTGDVAYAFGAWPSTKVGTVIPGRCISSKSDKEFVRGPRSKGKEKGGYEVLPHPIPRRLQHVMWLVRWFSEPGAVILDPFLGSGTTGIAAITQSHPFIGIEIDPRFFELACRRIEDAQRQQRMFA